MPEGRIVLSQCAIYLATSPKSNASYMAIGRAQQLVRKTGNLAVPLHLRNAPTQLMKELGYGNGYKYPHDYPNSIVKQDYLPEEIKKESILTFGSNSKEEEIKKKLQLIWGDTYNF